MTIPCGSSRLQERQVDYTLTAAVGSCWPAQQKKEKDGQVVDTAKATAHSDIR